MRFPHVNATPEQLWRWFKVPGTDAEVELKLASRSELQEIIRPTDLAAECKLVAERFFRAFKGCVDVNGVEIPNTVESRALLLQDHELGPWITTRLWQVKEWRDEGKGDGGSA